MTLNDNKTHVDNLFDSEGNLKEHRPKHPDFLRPAYQYTKAEAGKQCDKLNVDDMNE